MEAGTARHMLQTILVVDDDPAILQGIAILLRQSGYEIHDEDLQHVTPLL